MKKSITKQALGVLALLCSSAGMAATVTVTPSSAVVVAGNSFTVTISGSGFVADANPNLDQTTIGATLGLQIIGPGGITYVNPTPNNNAALPGSGPFSTANGGSYTPHPASGLPATFDVTTAVGASGSFTALVLTFNAVSAGAVTINLIDNQNTLAWFQYNDPFGAIPVSYNQGHLTVVAPVPAAAWLLMSALGSLAGLKRLRRQ